MQGEQRTPPPPWDDDPLSKFMSDAEYNARACVVNYHDVYDVLRRAHELLKHVCEMLEKDPADPNLSAPRRALPPGAGRARRRVLHAEPCPANGGSPARRSRSASTIPTNASAVARRQRVAQ